MAAPVHIMLSTGGTATVRTAADVPIRLVESGPAGGALAGAWWGRRTGHDDVLAFDMGGTTAKAAFTEHGEFAVTAESEVARVHRFKRGSGLPLLMPTMQMIEIGAGGGSIARLGDLGLPAVGPQSAASEPGPACYGRGGREPTVTDADLLLGYLDPHAFAGGTMTLDSGRRPRIAFGELAARLGMDAVRMAWGIHDLVNENMAAAARVHAAERGLDTRRYALVATGGAGPLHACGVARRLGLDTVVIPPLAGVGSAFGLLLAPLSFDITRSYVARLDRIECSTLAAVLEELEREGRTRVGAAGVADEQITVRRSADMRYAGQGYEIRVAVPQGAPDAALLDGVRRSFEGAYTAFYGQLCDGVPLEAVNWRVSVEGPRPDLRQVSERMAAHAAAGRCGSASCRGATAPSGAVRLCPRFRIDAGVPTPSAGRGLLGPRAGHHRGSGVHHRGAAGLERRRRHGWLPAAARRIGSRRRVMIDPITLEVLRNRLISIVDEQAAALIHASFTTVVREAGDLSAGVFDARGRMLAQAVTGTPGHINTMANCVRDYVVPRHPLAS